MVTTTITDNGASIKITNGLKVRNLIKTQIADVSVIKEDGIRIDMGGEDVVFIPYSEVSDPAAGDVNSLRETINAMLAPAVTVDAATEAKQNEQVDLLSSLNTQLAALKELVNVIKGHSVDMNALPQLTDGYHQQGIGNTIGQIYDYIFIRIAPYNTSLTYREHANFVALTEFKNGNPYVRLIHIAVDNGKFYTVTQE